MQANGLPGLEGLLEGEGWYGVEQQKSMDSRMANNFGMLMAYLKELQPLSLQWSIKRIPFKVSGCAEHK